MARKLPARIGRPPVSPEKKCDTQVSVAFPTGRKVELEDAAESLGMPVSAFVRQTLLMRLNEMAQEKAI